MRFIIVIAFFSALFFSCSSQKPLVSEYKSEALDFVNQWVSSPIPQNESTWVTKVEDHCDQGFTLPIYHSLDTLLSDVEKVMALDSAFIYLPEQQSDWNACIAGSEFLFRFLVAAQSRLEDYFEYETDASEDYAESILSPDGKTVYRFKQQVSDMLPITQANSRMSQKRTFVLRELIKRYPDLTTSAEKERFWLALERMFDPLRLNRSETGYDMFQRQSNGLSVKPSILLNRLEHHILTEPDEAIADIGRHVLDQARDNLSKPLNRQDQSLISTVDLNRIYMKNAGGYNSKFDLEQSQTEQADYWFERAFVNENPQLKIDYYTKVIQLDSVRAAAYNNRGNAYQAVGHLDSALSDYNRTLLLDENFQLAYKNRGSLFILLMDHEKAVDDFSIAIRLDPGCALCYADRGKAYLKLGNPEQALQDFDQAIFLDPSHAYIWHYRGICFLKIHDIESAVENLSRALELNPKFTPAWISRGDAHRYLERNEKAIQDYSKALEIEPDNTIALNNRAISYKVISQFDKAESDHQRALQLNPQDAGIYYNLGCLYWDQENWAAVIESWEKCLQIDPNHTLAAEWLPAAKEQWQKRR